MGESIPNAITGAFAGIGAYLAGLNWELIIIWFTILAIDVIVGTISALRRKKYKSNINRYGLIDKLIEVFFVISLIFGTYVVNEIAGINVPFIHFFLGAFIVKDLFSIAETAKENNLKIPRIIDNWLDMADEKMNSINEDDKE